ncbi:MAG: GAF domain-containing protein [Sporichthyaceae bacterium]
MNVGDVEVLRAELARSERMRRVLADVILAVGADLPLQETLVRVCAIVDDAYESLGGIVYLWDPEIERLVVWAITDPETRAGRRGPHTAEAYRIQLARGEGLHGWVFQHRELILIENGTARDPRTKLFAAIPEDAFASGVVLPILRANGECLGAVSLWARRPGHFTDEHVRVLSEVTSLLATVIDKARLDAESARRAKVLEFLGDMARRLSSVGQVAATMNAVAVGTAQVLDSDVCLIAALGPDGRFAVAGLAGAPPEGLSGEALFRELSQLLPARYAEAVSAPLLAGAEQLGFLTCYRQRRYGAADRDLLAVIAGQVALGWQALAARERTERNPAADLLAALAGGRPDAATAAAAAAVGLDLERPHVLLRARLLPADGGAVESGDRFARAAKHFVRTIESARPGSLLHESAGTVVGVVRVATPADAATLQRDIEALNADLTARLNVVATVGLSSSCSAIGEYADAHREAAEALEVGSRLRGEGTVARFSELGTDLYLVKMAGDPRTRRDPWLRALAPVVEHDAARGTDLLATLDVYLSSRGNVAAGAERLGLHRNTLRQRLLRIQALTGVDLDQTEDWLPLRLAVKLALLRERG